MKSPTLQEVQRDYEIWHGQQRATAPQTDLGSPWYQWLMRRLPPLAGKRVMEIACGRGALLQWMASRAAHAVGCDISETALGVARSNSPCNVAAGDIHHLPFPSNSFDLVVSCETLEHTQDPTAAMRELARVARPGGMLFATTPSYLNTHGMYRAYLRLQGRPVGTHGIQPIDRLQFSFGVLRNLKRAGWQIRETEGLVHYFRPAQDRLLWIERSAALSFALKHLALHFAVIASVRKSAGSGRTSA